jgi:hypothetical protein
MNVGFLKHIVPHNGTRYLFFGGKGGVGKTSMATATAVWFADNGYKTTIVSTDPTVSLSAMFRQEIGGEARVTISHVSNLSGLNINPADAKGVFTNRLNNTIKLYSKAVGKSLHYIASKKSNPYPPFKNNFANACRFSEGDSGSQTHPRSPLLQRWRWIALQRRSFVIIPAGLAAVSGSPGGSLAQPDDIQGPRSCRSRQQTNRLRNLRLPGKQDSGVDAGGSGCVLPGRE